MKILSLHKFECQIVSNNIIFSPKGNSLAIVLCNNFDNPSYNSNHFSSKLI